MGSAPRLSEPPGAVSGSRALAAVKIALLIALAAFVLYLFWDGSQWFRNPRAIKADVVAWGVWGPVGYILLYAVGPSFLLPGAVMTLAGGLAFGVLWGTAYALAGANLGALVAFGAGRFLGRDFVRRLVDDRFDALADRIARHGFRIIFYLRIVPVIPYNALNLLAGASPIGFRDYLWASLIGMIPGTIVFALMGDALTHPASARFFIALALTVAVVVVGEVFRRRGSVELRG